jgi:hypothetical protein
MKYVHVYEPARRVPAPPPQEAPAVAVRIPNSVRSLSGLKALIEKRQAVLLDQIGVLNGQIEAKQRKRAELQRKLNNIAPEMTSEFLARRRANATA